MGRGRAHVGGPWVSGAVFRRGGGGGGVAGRRSSVQRLRTPSDIAREQGSLAGGRAAGAPLRWPEGFAEGAANREALAVLLSLPSVTPRRLLELAATRPSAAGCVAAARGGLGCSRRDSLIAGKLDGRRVIRAAGGFGARFVAVGDGEYPARLLDLFDPPAGLFVIGHPLEEIGIAVALVGARNCSSAGREISYALAGALARAGACVVSGGARGIDEAAHAGALDAGGHTVSVLGCGPDVSYPPANRKLFARIAAEGAIVTEYPPGTPAEPFRFPARNRIVAGLSGAVVVVEGAGGSGSMITADHALELSRDLFAVPGDVASELAEAPLSLIRDGATLIRGPDDLLGDLGLEGPAGATEGGPPSSEGASRQGSLSAAQAATLAALTTAEPPDRLAVASRLPLPEVLAALVDLELRGLVRRVGGRYERRRPKREPR